MNFDRRMKFYQRNDCHEQIKLHRALLKYGFNSFDVQVLYSNIDKDCIDDLETLMISTYNSVEDGYNICPTGGSIKGLNHSVETKK